MNMPFRDCVNRMEQCGTLNPFGEIPEPTDEDAAKFTAGYSDEFVKYVLSESPGLVRDFALEKMEQEFWEWFCPDRRWRR